MLGKGLMYEYLFLFNRLPLEEIGEIVLKRKSASLQMLEKQIAPPEYTVEFLNQSSENIHFVTWISDRLSVSNDAACTLLKQYILDLKNLIITNGRLEWKHLGEWMADSSGYIYFNGFKLSVPGHEVLSAKKLIRAKSTHEVLIGDQTYSGESLLKLLGKNKKNVSKSRLALVITALIVAAAAVVLFCLIYIPDFRFFHQAQSSLKPKQHLETYKLINAE